MITFPTQSPHRKTDSSFFFFFKLFDRKLIYKEYPSEFNGACLEKPVDNPNSIVFEDRSLFLDFDERKHQFN